MPRSLDELKEIVTGVYEDSNGVQYDSKGIAFHIWDNPMPVSLHELLYPYLGSPEFLEAIKELGKPEVMAQMERERKEKQKNCPHEDVYSCGPSWTMWRGWQHLGYLCLDCGIQTDAHHPIGMYKGQKYDIDALERSRRKIILD